MKKLRRAACASLLAAAVCLPAHAESFASSASSAGSASSGSVSDSINGSSNSSSGDKKKVAAGQYRVIDIAQAPGKADRMRLTLRAAESGRSNEFYLDVPNRALDGQPLVAGNLVDVRERIAVNGQMIPTADFARLVRLVEPIVARMKRSTIPEPISQNKVFSTT